MSSVTLATLKERVLDRADLTGSDFIDTTQLVNYINDAISELWDLLVVSYQDYFLSSATLAVVPGQQSYALATVFSGGDFYKLVKVYAAVNSKKYPIPTFSLDDYQTDSTPSLSPGRYRLLGNNIVFSPEPTTSSSVELWYIPNPTVLASDSDSLTLTIPVGWMEYVVVSAAIRCLLKEESDATDLIRERDRIKMHIMEAAERDNGEPRRVRDVYRRRL